MICRFLALIPPAPVPTRSSPSICRRVGGGPRTLCFQREPERRQPNAHAVGAEALAVGAEDSDQSLGAGVGVPPALHCRPLSTRPSYLSRLTRRLQALLTPPAIPEATTRAEGSAAPGCLSSTTSRSRSRICTRSTETQGPVPHRHLSFEQSIAPNMWVSASRGVVHDGRPYGIRLTDCDD